MIELRSFGIEDAPVLIGWAVSEAFLLQWVGPTFRYPLDRAQIEQHLLQAAGPEPSILSFKVVDSGSDEMIGYVELCSIDRSNRSTSSGWTFRPATLTNDDFRPISASRPSTSIRP